MVTITALFFSYAADRMNERSRQFQVKDGTTIAELFQKEWAQDLAEPIETFLFSVNADWADRTQPLHHGDEVAVIPPVSGG